MQTDLGMMQKRGKASRLKMFFPSPSRSNVETTKIDGIQEGAKVLGTDVSRRERGGGQGCPLVTSNDVVLWMEKVFNPRTAKSKHWGWTAKSRLQLIKHR